MTITQRKRFTKNGFTLIEMMIAIAVLGLILGIVGPRVFGYWQRAKVAAAKTELDGINNAISNFQLDTLQYPRNLRDLLKRPADESISSKWQGPYLKKKEVPRDPWGNRYVYKLTSGKEDAYELYSYGPKGRGAPKSEWIRVTPKI